MKKICFLLLSMISFNLFADELLLFTDVSKATGGIRVYIKNISDEEQSVLTKNLSTMRNKDEVIIFPERHSLILNKGIVLLKEDLAYYGVVNLKPNEITYIKTTNIDMESSTIKYKINKEWGELHDVWAGVVEASLVK